jgi:hypothetical protein
LTVTWGGSTNGIDVTFTSAGCAGGVDTIATSVGGFFGGVEVAAAGQADTRKKTAITETAVGNVRRTIGILSGRHSRQNVVGISFEIEYLR